MHNRNIKRLPFRLSYDKSSSTKRIARKLLLLLQKSKNYGCWNLDYNVGVYANKLAGKHAA